MVYYNENTSNGNHRTIDATTEQFRNTCLQTTTFHSLLQGFVFPTKTEETTSGKQWNTINTDLKQKQKQTLKEKKIVDNNCHISDIFRTKNVSISVFFYQ